MKNTITACLPFSFKGEQHTPCYRIDLDGLMEKGQSFPQNLPRIIARENRIGYYSYEFEMLESAELIFDQATGLAKRFHNEKGEFDFEGFAEAWIVQNNLPRIQQIAQQEMEIENLDENPQLKSALLTAFRCGLKLTLPETPEQEESFEF